MKKPPSDDEFGTTGVSPRGLWIRLAVGIGIAIPAMAVPYLVMGFLLGRLIDAPTVARPVASAEAAAHVSRALLGWRAFGPIPLTSPSDPRQGAVERGIRGINGWNESGGWNGDGSDWYEVELTPALADELRAGLADEPTITWEATHYIQPSEFWPPWWPKRWPAGTRWYHRGLYDEYLILPPTGTRAWMYNWRS